MIINDQLTEDEKKILINFKKKYIDLYPDFLQEEIKDKLLLGFTNSNDIINQIYCYLKIVDDRINPYLYFSKFISEMFNISHKKILEVGSGIIPVLAKKIEDTYNVRVDCLDKLIIFKDYSKGTMIEDKFSLSTKISDYDLLIAYNPCGATEDMIRSSINNEKEFCIALCGCSFIPGEKNPPKWHEELYKLANSLPNSKLYEIEMVKIPQQYKIEWPIIYGKLIKK